MKTNKINPIIKSNQNPLISIITVVYNGDKYLEQTIKSVINQTYKNIEYIIVDGGSTDRTLEIIKKYEEQIDYWISEPDEGLYDAMNKGIRKANGDLIGMINSDDWYELNTVKQVVQSYINNPKKGVFHGDMYLISDKSKKILRSFNASKFKFKYYGMTYAHPTFFVSKKIYSKFQYNTRLKTISDYQFALEVFLDNSKTYYYIDQPLSNYRFGGLSDTIPTNKLLIDGFKARANAGLNIIQNMFSFLIRFVVFYSYKLKK